MNRFIVKSSGSLVVVGGLVLGVVSTSVLQASIVTSVLTTTPASGSTNRLTLNVQVPIFGDKNVTARVEGTINTRLEMLLNPFTGTLLDVSGLELTGGRCLLYDDSDGDRVLQLRWSIPFLASLNVDIQNLACTFDTPDPFGSMSPTTNPSIFEFPTEEHEVIINEGTAVAKGTGLAGSVDYSFDFNAEPMNATTEAIGKITVGNPTVAANKATYTVQIELPIAVDEALPVEGLGDVVITGSATFKAAGTFVYNLTSVGLPGDLNGDGYVGSADLDIVRSNWGQSVTPGYLAGGDCSGDGNVGSADLDIVRANWGAGAPPASAVPEPSLFAGFMALCLGGVSLRRR